MRNKIHVFWALLFVAAVTFASCSSMKQLWDLKGIKVSSNGQIYTGTSATIQMDVGSSPHFEFNATSDPVDNGYPVTVAVGDNSVVSVTQSASNRSKYTINGLRGGYTVVTASCSSVYSFTFFVYVTDKAHGLTLEKLKSQGAGESSVSSASSVASSAVTSSASSSSAASTSSSTSQTSSSSSSTWQSSSVPSGNDSYYDDLSDGLDWGAMFDLAEFMPRIAVKINKSGNTVESRIGVPEGYERVSVKAGSYEEFMRKLPLKADGSYVYFYNGEKKDPISYVAVYDFPQLNEDLLQCADACMKMRAEYFYSRGEYDKIGFTAESGVYISFSRYVNGERLTGSGWKSGYAKGASREVFDQYLKVVYSYASTRSIGKDVVSVNINDLKIGDMFIVSGSPGHAVFVTDMAVNKKTGKKIMLIGQGHMPAQDLHIVRSLDSTAPWFPVEDATFGCLTFTFQKGSQRRWKNN